MYNLTIKQENREKSAFYASDFGKPDLDLYFSLTGEEPSNPLKWQDTLRMGAGKGAEEAMLRALKDSGVVDENYSQKENGRVDMERHGVSIHGYIDAITKDGFPMEIKTINNKNYFGVKRYQDGTPRENYVGQLAIYMDFLGVEKGILFVSTIDGINNFWFECKRNGDIFTCGKTTIDLHREYSRWSQLKVECIDLGIKPYLFQYRYKHPIEEIDWNTVSKSDISKARNGNKVLGDWQISYSPWKDKIIALQGDTVGYSPEEIEFIRKATEGYSTK